jgi:4'-phosphopantetheinyl transferase
MTRRVAPGDGEVHLWRGGLDVSPQTAVELTRSLSVGERQRAQRARCESDRSRYASARGWLRQLLAGYVDADPADLLLGTDSDGKPRLRHPGVPWLHFNLSHSAGTVVVAVARREVGVDVEEIRRDFPIDAAARRFLSVREQRDLADVQYDRRIDAFFTTWSRREAYLKGIGVGLGKAEQGLGIPASWSLAAFEAGAGFAAAVAVEGLGVHVPDVAEPLTLI